MPTVHQFVTSLMTSRDSVTAYSWRHRNYDPDKLSMCNL